MAANSVAFNPNATTNAAGLFNVQAAGLYAGTFIESPETWYKLAAGVLAASETLPMWGGVGIEETIPTVGSDVRGTQVTRAADGAHLTGFSVFNQNGAAINSPQSPVPVTLSGGQVNIARLGSGMMVALAIDPTLISLDGNIITTPVSWDYTAQRIVAYDGVAALPIKILSIQTSGVKTVAYNSGTQVASWVTSGNAAALCII